MRLVQRVRAAACACFFYGSGRFRAADFRTAAMVQIQSFLSGKNSWTAAEQKLLSRRRCMPPVSGPKGSMGAGLPGSTLGIDAFIASEVAPDSHGRGNHSRRHLGRPAERACRCRRDRHPVLSPI